jgi:uncharacterized membrane protein
MKFILLAFAIGIIAGLRAMTAPAVTSWAARFGVLNLSGSWMAFLGYSWTLWIFTLAAIGELVNDKLPTTPSRKAPPGFIARIISGGLCGAAFGVQGGNIAGGIIAGMLGAVVGTLGGADLRARLAKAFGKDMPAALLEDAIAIAGVLIIVSCAR